jgi:hypothetical protein
MSEPITNLQLKAIIDGAGCVMTTPIWICPVCKHEQIDNFDWCGKNLKCNGCDESSYYKEWTIK